MTAEQQKIFKGLKNIGESLANFYLDAVGMISPDNLMKSKANLIAHAAREIDGGLRDVFAPDKVTEGKKTILSDADKDCDDKNKGKDYFSSILAAVGTDDAKNTLANKWYGIAKNFHRIAHRRNIHSSSVDATEIISLWYEYEKVLTTIIGSFLGITNRLDVILSLEQPQINSLPAINNILKNPKYANYFFSRLDKVLWLYPLRDKGYFNPDSAPQKAENANSLDYWYPIKYLLNISAIAHRNVKNELVTIINHIMDSYIKANIELHPYVVTDILQIIINVDDFSFNEKEKLFFEKYSGNFHSYSWSLVHRNLAEGLTPKLIGKKDIEGLKNLLDYFFGFATIEKPGVSFFGEEPQSYTQVKPYVEDDFIMDFLSSYGESIIELLGASAIRIAMQKLTDLSRVGSNPLLNNSPASIEPTSQSVYAHGWEPVIIYFIRDFSSKLNQSELNDIIEELLDSRVEILKRLAIHLIRENFSVFDKKWWEFIEKTSNDYIYIHEPYILIREHSENFTDEQFEATVLWIERINSIRKGEEVEVELAKQHVSYRIRRWLTALRPKSEKSKALLAEKEKFYFAWNNAKMIDHPEFDSYGTSSIGYDHPMTNKEFQKLSIESQINYINIFKPKHTHDTSEEGLAELLKNAVFFEPGKYAYSLESFLPLHSLYVDNIVDGFTAALKKDKDFDFSLVLTFIESRLAEKSFREESEKKFPYKKWFGTSVSELIACIAGKKDQLKLSKEDVERMILLILTMINMIDFQDNSEEVTNGYFNHVLNSIPGRLYMALMQLAHIWAESYVDKDDPVKWIEALKKHFSGLVQSNANKDKEFSIILGVELPLLLFIDKTWVAENLNSILDEQSSHFKYRISSIFSRHYQLSRGFYNFLKQHDIFSRALRYFNKESIVLDEIIVYGILEWKLWGGKPEGGSIISEIFNNENPQLIKRLIYVAWEQKLLSEDEAIYLWDCLFPQFELFPELAEDYSILLWFFESIFNLTDKVFNLSTNVISKTKHGNDIYRFLRHLYEIKDTNIEFSGKLVLQIYSNKLATVFLEGELKKMVEKLYHRGLKELADNICVQIAEQGSLVLKELFNRYN